MTSCGRDIIETAALGRPFQLGMLYDCRKDALIPGITLWDKEQLEQNTSVRQQNNTEFNVTTSDSIEEKSNSLKISGSLKLSLLGGLVNVGGSAKYFKDTKKSRKQARVTLQYQTTTRFETLTMAHLASVCHPKVFEDDIATHVVAAILYGAGAYFLFDRESSSQHERKQVECEANLTFNKLISLAVDVGGSVSFNMDDQEKSAVEKFICTFHGDFKLPSNPTTFNDAVRVYGELPKMLGENGELAVPLKVWLYPLCKLDSKAIKLQRNISNDLIIYSADIIESLTKAVMRCNDILKDTPAAIFPAIDKNVQDLRQKCHHYKLNFMQKLGAVLPAIRGGDKEESSLVDLLKTHGDSPFNGKELHQWLTNKEKESGTLKSYLKQLQKLGADINGSLDDLLTDLDVKNVVCFSFTSLDDSDVYLAKLCNYLNQAGMFNTSVKSSDLQAENKDWFSTDRQRVRERMKLFGELKKMNTGDDIKFVVDSKYDKSHPGVCIFIYEDGSDDAVQFIPPSKPATPTTTGVSYNSVTVQVSDPDSATVKYQIDYRVKGNPEAQWKSQPVQKSQVSLTLSGLMSQTEYEIRATAVGKLRYAVNSACSVASTTLHLQTPVFQIRSGCPVIYELPVKKEVVGNFTRMTVGEKSVNTINKTVLLFGERGDGKSTLINALVNYAMGVTWEDKIWYEIIERQGYQSEIHQIYVNVYEIFGFEDRTLPYSLTIIDIDEFGDRGPEHDVMIMERLFDCFQSEDGIHKVNAIGLVMKSTQCRLTDRQIYMYNSLMSLFAKDIVENCVALITYSNGRYPQNPLKSLKKANIKCAQNERNDPLYFLFDNCQNESRTEDDLEYAYKLSAEGMKAFTAFLGKTQPQSLKKKL